MPFLRLPVITTAVLALSALMPAVGSAQEEDCAAADMRPSEATNAETRAATLCLMNIERKAAGRPELRQQVTLRVVATRYSRQMVEDNFFSHVSPSGSTLSSRIKRSSYLKGARSYALGENLAWGQGSLATPREIVESWMDSPGHRANILSPKFKDVGIGVVEGTPGKGSGGTYTTNFGRRG